MQKQSTYILYACNERKEKESMRLVIATKDRETLLSKIGNIVLDKNMEYGGQYGKNGLVAFKEACKNNSVNFAKLDYGYVDEAENIQIADFAKTANPINKVVSEFITHQKSEGLYNDYVSNVLLKNIDEISNNLIDCELFGAYAQDNLISACRHLMETENMQHDYQGYGEFMLPLTQAEALEKYDNGEPVFLIYDGDAEGMVDERSDIEGGEFFYALELSNEIEKTQGDILDDNANPLQKETSITDLKKQEFIRMLALSGYQFIKAEEHDPNIQRDYYGPDRIIKGGSEIMIIDEENQMLYRPEFREEAIEIFNIRQTVSEYVSAFLKAKDTDARLIQDYFSLSKWKDCVLGAKQMQDDSFQFVTWDADKSGNGYNHGHYHSDFETAKEDFAVRSGLINKDKLFSETEMKIIRSGLVKYTELDSDIDYEREKAVNAIVEKIDTLVVPEIAAEQEHNDEMGEESELEL